MPKQLKIILKEVPSGLEPTPKQTAQRERFALAAHECKEVFKNSKLKGADKVRRMNAWMREQLQREITL